MCFLQLFNTNNNQQLTVISPDRELLALYTKCLTLCIPKYLCDNPKDCQTRWIFWGFICIITHKSLDKITNLPWNQFINKFALKSTNQTPSIPLSITHIYTHVHRQKYIQELQCHLWKPKLNKTHNRSNRTHQKDLCFSWLISQTKTVSMNDNMNQIKEKKLQR